MVSSEEEADAGQLILGPLQSMIAPDCAEGVEVIGFINGVRIKGLLPAGECLAMLLGPDLPAAGVPAEERYVAAGSDVCFQLIPHPTRPVFVVSEAEDEFVVLEYLRMLFEVEVGGVVEGEAVLLGPLHEGVFPVRVLARLRALEGDAVALQVSPPVVGVEAATAPVVVGVVGVGRELEQNFGVLSRLSGTQDEEGFGLGSAAVADDELAAPIDDAEDHLVIARSPVGWNRHLKADRPVATVRAGMLGDRVEATAGNFGLLEDDLALGSETSNLNAVVDSSGRSVKGEFLPRREAVAVGIALDGESGREVGLGESQLGAPPESQNRPESKP